MLIETGSLLVSPPTMPDPRFGQTVLMLTQHGPRGAFALAINKKTNHDINRATKEMGIVKHLPFEMYWGGPVHPGSIWMLHSKDWSIDQSMHITDEWKITSHEAMFHHLADGDAPRWFRICFGFSSWGTLQLDRELERRDGGSWLTAEAPDPESLFSLDDSKLWSKATQLAAKEAVNEWLP